MHRRMDIFNRCYISKPGVIFILSQFDIHFLSPSFMRFIRAELDFLAPKIEGILQQGDVELRIASGEAISVCFIRLVSIFSILYR